MGTMDPQLFCLRWNNHQNNLLSVFDQLLQIEAFCDVTLAVEGSTLKCHKVILAASSLYFQSIFMENTCKHPIVFLKDIKFSHVKALLDYMYHGEVSIEEEELQGLLKVAEALKVKGLVEIDEDGSTATPKVVFPYVKPGKFTTPVSSFNGGGGSGGGGGSNSGGGSRSEDGRTMVVSPLPAQRQNKIWPASPAKLLAPLKKEDGEGEDHILVIDEEESNCSTSIAMNSDLEYLNYLSDETPPAPGMIRTIGPNGKLEWKRYKQYTKDDILAAIEEVKSGMSALQASRKYGVPSRTLYDKVKKMGILTANMQKQIGQKKPTSAGSSQQQSPSMPHISLLGLQLPQVSLQQQQQQGSSSPPHLHRQSSSSEERTTGVGPSLSGAMMISMLERLKANSNSMQTENPLNLSTILSQRQDDSASGSGSDSGHSSSEQEGSKEEKTDLDIRAQLFADLHKMKMKEMPLDLDRRVDLPPVTSLNGGGSAGSATAGGTAAVASAAGNASCHSVTLIPRDDLSPLPRKRKFSQEEGEEPESQPQDLKKSALEEPGGTLLHAETTSF